MSEEIVVPVLGESITEATVSKWLKKSGDSVKADEPIVELETDKVNLEVPSPVSGVLSNIKTKEGETVKVGALLGVVTGGENAETKKIEKIKPENQFKTEPKEIAFCPLSIDRTTLFALSIFVATRSVANTLSFERLSIASISDIASPFNASLVDINAFDKASS